MFKNKTLRLWIIDQNVRFFRKNQSWHIICNVTWEPVGRQANNLKINPVAKAPHQSEARHADTPLPTQPAHGIARLAMATATAPEETDHPWGRICSNQSYGL